jgi:hypothetical protein
VLGQASIPARDFKSALGPRFARQQAFVKAHLLLCCRSPGLFFAERPTWQM